MRPRGRLAFRQLRRHPRCGPSSANGQRPPMYWSLRTGRLIAGYAALRQSLPLASHSMCCRSGGWRSTRPPALRVGAGSWKPASSRPAAGRTQLSLRVLGGNVAARRLYESCRLTVEESCVRFFLGGRYVDTF